MRSDSRYHFPRFRFVKGKKWLYNPVLKKRFSNRPEERVRLRYVEFLLSRTNFSKNRIGFEAPVKISMAENPLRADLVLYTKALKPYALIECKSEKVKLTEKTAEQASRYNRELKADYIMMTNGSEEIWVTLEGGKAEILRCPLEFSPVPGNQTRDISYWSDRGFISPDTSNETGNQISEILNRLFLANEQQSVQYLDVPASAVPFQSDHYYRILPASHEQKIAITLLNNGQGSTVLTAILNQNGKNRGFLCIDMDQLAVSEAPRAVVVKESGMETLQLSKPVRKILTDADKHLTEKIADQLLIFFD